MPSYGDIDDRKQIAEIRAAWEAYDNTDDIDTVADYLADEIVIMPPGGSPIGGKEAVIEALTPPAGGDYETDTDQLSEGLFISGDLAVDRVAMRGTKVPAAGDDPVDVSHKGVDVYRRTADGKWKQIIAIWNTKA